MHSKNQYQVQYKILFNKTETEANTNLSKLPQELLAIYKNASEKEKKAFNEMQKALREVTGNIEKDLPSVGKIGKTDMKEIRNNIKQNPEKYLYTDENGKTRIRTEEIPQLKKYHKKIEKIKKDLKKSLWQILPDMIMKFGITTVLMWVPSLITTFLIPGFIFDNLIAGARSAQMVAQGAKTIQTVNAAAKVARTGAAIKTAQSAVLTGVKAKGQIDEAKQRDIVNNHLDQVFETKMKKVETAILQDLNTTPSLRAFVGEPKETQSQKAA